MEKTEEDWKKELSEEEYKILREKSTELPFSSEFVKKKEKGDYVCTACGNILFKSDNKFDSGSGWPSFSDVVPGKVKLKEDDSMGMKRVEVVCSKCGGHLGHLFDDGPKPTGKRYCINGKALNFENEK